MNKSRRMPPHVQDFFDKRDGRRYLYFRKPGHKRVRLPLPIGSEEFWTACKAALASKSEIGAERTIAGSVSASVVAFYSSAEWNGLSEGTRHMRRQILDAFRTRYGTWPLRQLTENFVVAYLESLKPHAARNHLKTLRRLLRHAKHDVTRDIKAPKAKSVKHPSWPAEMIAKYEAHHAIGTKPRLCFALGKYTGAGRTEITRIGPQHIGDGEIIIPPRQKTGVPATLPLHPELRAIIEATPLIGTKTFLVTDAGKPYRPSNLSDRFRNWCNAAGIPAQYSLHGLRHAMGDLLAELGANPNEIAAVLAHSSVKSALHYTQGADRKRMARSAMARVIGGTKQGRSGNTECLGDNPTQTIDGKKSTEIK